MSLDERTNSVNQRITIDNYKQLELVYPRPPLPPIKRKTSLNIIESRRNTVILERVNTLSHSLPPVKQHVDGSLTYSDLLRETSKLENSTTVTPTSRSSEETVQIYLRACHRWKVLPTTIIKHNLTTSEIIIHSYYLGLDGTRALCVALVHNPYVRRLDLTDNWLAESGAVVISEMLETNQGIRELVLSENRLRSIGAKAICDAITKNRRIIILDLSNNHIKDEDSSFIIQLLNSKTDLKSLNLSQNELRENGGIHLGRAIRNNDILQTLDVSWNHLRNKGAICFCKGLKENVGLRKLDISWNGFAVNGATALGIALKSNRTLQFLNLSSNRIHTAAVFGLLKGLVKNDGLLTLELRGNPFSHSAAMTLLRTLEKTDSMKLCEIDFGDIPVNQEFINLKKNLDDTRNVIIEHGPIMNVKCHSLKKDTPNVVSTDPLKVFFSHLSLKGMRVVDLYKRFDKGRRDQFILSKDQFKEGISSIQIPLTLGGVERIMENIETKNEHFVDIVGLFADEKKFRRKVVQQRTKKPLIKKKRKDSFV